MNGNRFIRIGTCGYRSSKEDYAKTFSAVEIHNTFYEPPQIRTLERWRNDTPPDFEFTLKAWQLITHESSSPTYRRLRRKLTEREKQESGFFRDTDIVSEAWERTLTCAHALGARMILFQCPAKFTPTDENVANLKNFFSRITRGEINFAWEPRGQWSDRVVSEICDELDLWHVVDPFSQFTTTPQNCYYRLHGIPRWRYTFEEGELEELTELLPQNRLSYVFFNNITMREDAQRFHKIISNTGIDGPAIKRLGQ